MGELQQYTYEDVQKCNGKKRIVFVISNKVYDVTEFLNEHPGGEEVLMDQAGKDATEDFNDVGHSTDAVSLMSKYQVGEIVADERRNVHIKAGWPNNYGVANENINDSRSGFSIVMIVAAVLLGLLAVLYFTV